MNTTFTDGAGREWRVNVTPYEYEKIKVGAEIDLYDICDEEKSKQLIETLELNDVTLSEILWLIVQDEAEEKEVDRKSFVKSLDGEALNRGYDAILGALAFFFRRREQRELMQKLRQYVSQAGLEIEKRTMPEIDKIDVQQAAETFAKQFIARQQRPESTPSQPTEMAHGGTPPAS